MPTETYRPSNGTEGEIFMECFCFRCARDAEFQDAMARGESSDKGCPILAASFVYSTDDPKYPKEWVRDIDSDVTLIGGNGARCTAFVERGKDIPYRCPSTPDMF